MIAYNTYIHSINLIQETLIGYSWKREETNLHARIIELEKNLDNAKERLGMGEDQMERFLKSTLRFAEDKGVCYGFIFMKFLQILFSMYKLLNFL